MKKCQADKTKAAKIRTIKFFKAGDRRPQKRTDPAPAGILRRATDRELTLDKGKHLEYTMDITQIRLRPDVLLNSRNEKMFAMLALAIPWESRMEEAHERKKGSELCEVCQE